MQWHSFRGVYERTMEKQDGKEGIMAKLTISAERCKSCKYCISVCPTKSLSLSGKLNAAGYDYVTVDHEKCTQCGTCYLVCPDNVFEVVE